MRPALDANSANTAEICAPVPPQLARYNSPSYSFERDGNLVRVYVREGCRHLDTFRMPRDCRTLMQFAAAFFSYRDLGSYKVTA